MPKFVYDLVEKTALQATMQGGYVPRQEIASMLGTASVELQNFYIGKPSQLQNGRKAPAVGDEVSREVSEALEPFRKRQDYAPIPGAGELPISSIGIIDLPADMRYLEAFNTAEGLAPVKIVARGQGVFITKDPIVGPTAENPAAEQLPGNRMQLLTETMFAYIDYIGHVPVPVYAEVLNPTTGELEYDDATSVDVGWGRQHEPELIERTLRLLAQATRDGQLSNTAAALTQDNI